MRGRVSPLRLLLMLSALASAAPVVAAPTFAPGKSRGNVEHKDIVEASGIVASRANDNVLWIHNDSGAAAELFAVSTGGKLLGRYRLPGVKQVDCEDIAIGPGPIPGLDYIYWGDIGDNASARKSIKVYRIPEPAVYERQQSQPAKRDLKGVETITLTYPDGSHNAETLLVDPIGGDLFVGTKQDAVTKFYGAVRADLAKSKALALRHLCDVKFSVASAGDISPSGREILLRREEAAVLFQRAPGQKLREALASEPVKIPVVGPPTEPNGEAICFDAAGRGYFTFSEERNQPLHYFERTSQDGPPEPIVLVPAGAEWKYLDDGSDQGEKWREPGFDDSAWPRGAAQLGYGDDDEGTAIKFGSDPARRHITYYFRRQFQAQAAAVGSLTLRLVFDDGAAVYLNGKPLQRVNLESGATAKSLATRSPAETEDSWFTYALTKDALVDGVNTLAVEVHQRSADSTDLSFDLQLLARPPQ